jgi:transcriptional regulator with GAF, ATPase, and Fis domain
MLARGGGRADDSTVLITGETGTNRLVAHAIHRRWRAMDGRS